MKKIILICYIGDLKYAISYPASTKITNFYKFMFLKQLLNISKTSLW